MAKGAEARIGEDRVEIAIGANRGIVDDVEPDVSEAKGPLSQDHVMDGLQLRAFMRLMRGWAASRYIGDEAFESEWERRLERCRHWVLR